MNRRLAAVLAADIAGYSTLMGADQARMLVALRQFRTGTFEPAVAGHRGKLFKSMGDGWLVEFASAVDAVTCAMHIQEQLAGHATIALRIGIHVGDVVHEDRDVFGDGVNVAARLEALAEPGSVVISDAVLSSLDEVTRAPFLDGGDQRLKNISRPVRVWRSPAVAGPIRQRRTAPGDRPSIAVTTFTNLSGDPLQDELGEGLSEDIVDALARCRWLRVVSPRASAALRERTGDVRGIARELGVRYVLDGAIRRTGNRVRIAAHLVSTATGDRLWGNRYDRDARDIFELQDEVAETIAGSVEPELSAIEGAALRARPIGDLSAWECFQLGLLHLYRFEGTALQSARDLLERAVGLDETFAPALARLAYVHVQLAFYGPREERAAHLDDALALARQALRLDDRDPSAWLSLGRALALQGASGRGIDELRKAVDLAPSFAQARFALAQALCFADHPDEALSEIAEAMRISPHDPHFWTFLHTRALARYIAGDLKGAAEDERAALLQPNATHWPALVLVAILGHAGRTEEAKAAIDDLLRMRPDMTCSEARRECTPASRALNTDRFMAQFLDDLRAAGLPDGDASLDDTPLY